MMQEDHQNHEDKKPVSSFVEPAENSGKDTFTRDDFRRFVKEKKRVYRNTVYTLLSIIMVLIILVIILAVMLVKANNQVRLQPYSTTAVNKAEVSESKDNASGEKQDKEKDKKNKGGSDDKSQKDEKKTDKTTAPGTKPSESQTAEKTTKPTEKETEATTKPTEKETEATTKPTEKETEETTEPSEKETEETTKAAEKQTEETTKPSETESKPDDLFAKYADMSYNEMKKEALDISSLKLQKDPEKYIGELVIAGGKVKSVDGNSFIIMEDYKTGGMTLEQYPWLVHYKGEGEPAVVKNNVVNFYGVLVGIEKITLPDGSEKTAPVVDAAYYYLSKSKKH